MIPGGQGFGLARIDRMPAMLIVGSAIFLFGAALGVPRVFMTEVVADRLHLLTEHVGRWRLAQFPYALGPLVAAAAVMSRSPGVGRWAQTIRLASGWVMLVGAIAWSYSCWLRGADPVAFVNGSQPGWPFVAYVILTIVGIAGVGGFLLMTTDRTVLAWTILLADLGCLLLYVATHDIPPFVFYLLLLGLGLAL